MNSTTEPPHFDIEPEYALETLMAADFLDSTSSYNAWKPLSGQNDLGWWCSWMFTIQLTCVHALWFFNI